MIRRQLENQLDQSYFDSQAFPISQKLNVVQKEKAIG